MLTSVSFEGSRATGSVFQLFQKPGAVGCSMRKNTYTRDGRNTRGGGGGGGGCSVVECKIELTFVKLGAAYYGMYRASRIYIQTENSPVRTTRLARSRLPIISTVYFPSAAKATMSHCVYGVYT